MTYGCLLRPHQEIRLLKWEDFSDDLSHINLTGSKVKSKRNRIVPVPKYMREILVKGENQDNIFSPKANNPTIRAISRSFGGDLRGVIQQLSQVLQSTL